jgi:ABC-type multidrug transport system fused ATPase/permease subunit
VSKKSDEKANPEEVSTMQMVRLVSRFMGSETRLFTLAGFMLVFEAATAVLIPLLLAYVIDYVAGRISQITGAVVIPPPSPLQLVGLPTIINPDVDTIGIITLGIIILTMINSLGDSLAEIYLAQGGRRLGFNLRVSLYAHLQKLSLAFHDQRRTGDILTRVTGDVAAIEDFVISSLSDFVGSVLLIVFILVAMVLNAWQVALMAAIIFPVMGIISNYFTSRIKAASKKRRASEGELASATQEMLTSIRVIQTYGMGSYEQELFAKQSQKAMDAALDAARYQAQYSWVVSVLGAFSIAAVVWVAVFLVFREPISIAGIGLLTAYVKYIQDMFKPTKRIIQEWNTFGKLYASVERIGDLLRLKPAIEDVPGAVDAPPIKGRIEFRNVNFTYTPISADGSGTGTAPRNALEKVNFVIEPGEVVALVGQTGAGKSTVAQLIPRLYDPTLGQILIDGVDSRTYTVDSLRAQISMVLQESILFTGSVVENIAYGRPDASGREIVTAAMQANAHEFIEKLPEGYYTMLGERGSNLSGGQRQRIAIARAFVRRTSILILDEPTTGLDAESTELVLKALRKLMKGKTTIIISHDLGLIQHADKIIVINNHTVEDVGTHESLLKSGGLYATLYQMQTGQVPGKVPSRPIDKREEEAAREDEVQLAGGMEKPKDAAYDLPHHPAFLERLPALEDAFDALLMRGRLQQALFGFDQSRYKIDSAQPGKAIFLPGNVCSFQYTIDVRETAGSHYYTALVNVRLFPDLDSAQAYRRKFLDPLGILASNRPELLIYKYPVGIITDLALCFSVFPIDGEMPTLLDVTRPDRMLPVFKQTLPESLSGGFTLDGFRLEPAHYGRYQRCVLRYHLSGRQTETEKPQEMVVYGIVDADGLGGITVPVIASLREQLREARSPYSFRIPRTLAYLPDLNLLLLETLQGSPQFGPLLKTRIKGQTLSLDGGLTLEGAIQSSARIAAAFHSSGIQLGRKRTLEGDVNIVKQLIEPILEITPEFGNRLSDWLDIVASAAQEIAPLPPGLCHGDYSYNQLIFAGKDAGLVDFDSVCQAEPALDLGQFLAYQRLTISKDQSPRHVFPPEATEELCELFISTYLQSAHDWIGSEQQLRGRVEVYEILSLLRVAAHSWQKLKGVRLQAAMTLLKERIECLKQVN